MNAKKSKFAAKTVKAVALRCWWNERKKQKLGEHFNLTVEQINALRKTSEYRKVVESLMLGQRTSQEFEKWISGFLGLGDGAFERRMGRRMGLDEKVLHDMIETVRKQHELVEAGKMKAPKMIPNPSKFHASSPNVLGSGHEFVYLYYFPTYQKYAKLLDESRYPCNIGRAEADVIRRVGQQTGQQLPEKIRIALIMRTEDCRTLESKIHKELKGRKRWLDPNSNTNVVGIEWFLTNPAEVKRIFRKLQGE